MPKACDVKPDEIRKAGEISFKPIPVNTYQKSVSDEHGHFTEAEFLKIYNDMFVIREFETMLNLIKTTNEYNGIEYNHAGPAHLSIGQEAAAVGMAYDLTVDDFIFGSHRSHGEILAKGLSAISRLDDDSLMEIMKAYPRCLSVVEKNHAGSVKDLAIDFLLYGTLAEIFGRANGFNKGMGGSMHVFFLPFGIYPNNAIVGGSADIAAGAALYKKVNSKPGIVVANIGDASIGCGPVWEALCFATMDQYKQLWDEAHRGGLPLIFNFMNNHYGMGGQPAGETMGFGELARLGAGVTPDMMHAERVDGYNPLAVIDVMRRKKAIIEQGDGPVLLDTITYRISGHSPSDASSYRTKEEIAKWESHDSIEAFGEQLIQAAVATADHLETMRAAISNRLTTICSLATDETISPRIDLTRDQDAISSMMFSGKKKTYEHNDAMKDLTITDDNPRLKQLKKKVRVGMQNGVPVPKAKTFQLRDALFESIFDAYKKDSTLVAYGEENRDWGGAFAVYRGLTEMLPYHRLFNSPISEAAIVGSAVGYGMCGGSVIAELMYCDFLGRAGDEVFNQLSKWQAMSGGLIQMPIIIRVSVGSKYGAQHSQDWTSMVAHIPGLKVVFPVTPYDAKGLLTAALNGTDPVIFFESQRIYDIGELFHKDGVPEESYEVPIGEPDIKREGADLTIFTIGATLYRALEAADILEEQYGLSAEVIDARSIVPFNYDKVVASVEKTGRIVLASDACERGSHLKDMAQTISELAFDSLDAPPVVVGARNWITPPFEMEPFFFPQADWIIDAIHEKILPLRNHTVHNNFTVREQLRRNRLAV